MTVPHSPAQPHIRSQTVPLQPDPTGQLRFVPLHPPVPVPPTAQKLPSLVVTQRLPQLPSGISEVQGVPQVPLLSRV